MISPTKLRENKIHAEAENAKRQASSGEIYISRGNDVFEFIPGKDLPIDGVKLSECIAGLRQEISKLQKAISEVDTKHEAETKRVKDALILLAEELEKNNVL